MAIGRRAKRRREPTSPGLDARFTNLDAAAAAASKSRDALATFIPREDLPLDYDSQINTRLFAGLSGRRGHAGASVRSGQLSKVGRRPQKPEK